MNLSELIERLRIDLDDVDIPQLWSTPTLVQFVNEALDEVCLRARLIRDSDTSGICEIRVRPGVAQYSIDQRVIQVLRARIKSQIDPLNRTGFARLDRECRGWESAKGMPAHYLMDMDACKIKLVPTPTAYDYLSLTVERRPLSRLVNDGDEPEIASHHHINMLEWTKHLAYSIQDADSFDAEAAEKHANKFAGLFGQRRNAENEELLRAGMPTKVLPDFF